MAEVTTAQAATANDQASQTTSQPDSAQAGTTAADQASIPGRSAADIERELKEVRAEAAKYRTAQRDLEARLKKYDDDKLSDTDRLSKAAQESEKKAFEAESRLQEALLRIAVEREARKLNVVDEDAAYRLLDISTVEYDDQGKPRNVESLLKTLVKDKPYLIKAATPPPGDVNSQQGRGSAPADDQAVIADVKKRFRLG